MFDHMLHKRKPQKCTHVLWAGERQTADPESPPMEELLAGCSGLGEARLDIGLVSAQHFILQQHG